MTPLVPVTVVVPTLDEEANLDACLASVAWADELVVVDSGSRDRTLEIARGRGATVVVRPFTGYGAQRNHGAGLARHSWIFCLDADERASEAVGEEIARTVSEARHSGYRIPRRAHVAGRVIRRCGWGRDRVLRLYDRRHGSWDDRAVHERVVLDGPIGDLSTPLDHYTYRGLGAFAAKTARYAALGAQELHSSGRRAGLAQILGLPLARFVRMYLLQAGFLDRVPGLIVCGLASYGVFLKYAHLWELGRTRTDVPLAASTPGDTP